MVCSVPPPPGRANITDVLRLDDPLPGPTALILIAGFWLAAGVTAGVGTWLAGHASGAGISVADALAAPMVAGVWWIPLTVGAVVLARQVPVHGPRRWLPALLHGLAAVGASFLLNVGVQSTLALFGRTLPVDVPEAVLAGGLRWLHLNAATYLVIVAAVHAVDASPGERPDGDVPDPDEEGPGKAGHGAGTAPRPGPVQRTQASPSVEADRLKVGAGTRTGFVEVDAIDWIEADGDYARVHADGAEHLCSERLKVLAARLDGRFVRVHRSTIVNVERIRSLRHVSHGDYEAVLEDGTVRRVSRRRREALQEALDRKTVAG